MYSTAIITEIIKRIDVTSFMAQMRSFHFTGKFLLPKKIRALLIKGRAVYVLKFIMLLKKSKVRVKFLLAEVTVWKYLL